MITKYGYAAIMAGTFVEGETILVLGGFAAHRGYLELPWVIVSAFLGSFSGDQLYFYIGRAKGMDFLDTRPNWKGRAEKVFALLRRHQVLLILAFRFMYGLRTITPFLLGASKISRLRFFILNLLGALIWAIALGVLGYFFGQAMELLIGDIKGYENWLFLAIVVVGLVLWGTHLIRNKGAP